MRVFAALALLTLAAADVPEAIIPAEFGLVEGIAWDSRSRQMFAGTVEDGALLVREGDHWRRAILPYSTAGFFGMAVDQSRGILWISSGVAGPTVKKNGFRGLIGVTSQGFVPVGHAAVPVADTLAEPGDVAIAPDGSVYVSDAAGGGVYLCKPGCTVLEPLVATGTFGSAQGMAVSRDGRTLYVADYGRGLFRVDLKKPKAAILITPLKGIDGLIRYGDALLAIVNGDGRRIVRLGFDAHGGVTSELLATPQGPGDPTLGVIIAGQLVYIADAQWDRFDRSGKSIAKARETTIRTIALPSGPGTKKAPAGRPDDASFEERR